LSERAQTTAGFCVIPALTPRAWKSAYLQVLPPGSRKEHAAPSRTTLTRRPENGRNERNPLPGLSPQAAVRAITSLPRRAHGDEAWTSARERPETPCEIISAGSLLCQTQGVTPRSGSTHGRSGVDRAVRRCRSRSTRGGHARSMSGRALVGTQVCEIGELEVPPVRPQQPASKSIPPCCRPSD
jgi:hypothetical protein